MNIKIALAALLSFGILLNAAPAHTKTPGFLSLSEIEQITPDPTIPELRRENLITLARAAKFRQICIDTYGFENVRSDMLAACVQRGDTSGKSLDA